MAGETILLVETSEKLIQQFAEPFKKVGYNLISTQWGEEAMTIVQQQTVHAVVMRSKLPGMTSLQFLQNLRRNPGTKNRPVVIIYGKDDIDLKVQSFKAGADDYLVLPFSMPELFFRIDVRLRKTVPNEETAGGAPADTVSMELDIPPSFPTNGNTESRSLPFILGNIYQRSITGTLRLISGKKFFAFYFESGLLRAAKSSVFYLRLPRQLERWGLVPALEKKRFEAIVKTLPDAEVAVTCAKTFDVSHQRMNAAAVRSIYAGLSRVLRMKKVDYDWLENEIPKDMFLCDSPGINPALLILSFLRTAIFRPSYKLFLPKPNQYLVVSPRAGRLGETMRLAPVEQAFIDWTVSGRSVGEVLTSGKRLFSFGSQLLHILISFDGLKVTDKKPTGIKVTAEDKKSEEEYMKSEPVVAHDSEEMLAIRLEDSHDEEPKPAPVKAAVLPGSKSPQPVRPEPSQAMPDAAQAKPRTAPPEVKTTDKEQPPPRMVRELFPDRAPDREETHEKAEEIPALALSEDQLRQGQLKKTPFAFLYATLAVSQKTGILSIDHNSFQTRLYWRKGKLIFARTDDPKLRLDQVMLDMGMITAQQRQKVNEMIAEMGKMRSGTIIFKQQLVNMMQLSDALHHQINLIMDELFQIVAGAYQFEEHKLPEEEHIPLDLPTDNVLLEGMRKASGNEILTPYLPDLSTVLSHTQKTKSGSGRLKLGPLVMGVLDKFRHGAPVKEAFAGSEVNLKEFKIILLGLMLLDLLASSKKKD